MVGSDVDCCIVMGEYDQLRETPNYTANNGLLHYVDILVLLLVSCAVCYRFAVRPPRSGGANLDSAALRLV